MYCNCVGVSPENYKKYEGPEIHIGHYESFKEFDAAIKEKFGEDWQAYTVDFRLVGVFKEDK